MSQFLPLIVIALLAWWWWDSMRAREAAVAAGKRACRAFDSQFLDDSVVLSALRPHRQPNGSLALARLYRFEFTREGQGRHDGYARLVGRRVVDVHLDAVAVPPTAIDPVLERAAEDDR